MNSSFPIIGINWISIKKAKREFLVVIRTLPPQVPITCRSLLCPVWCCPLCWEEGAVGSLGKLDPETSIA